jgi:hypothetical protein
MSFWDTLAGLFTGDTYFPDNPKREARAKELARDCQDYSVKLSSLTKQIQSDLTALNKDIAKLYGDPARMPSGAQVENINFNEMAFQVSGLIAPLITAPVVSSALTVGATSYLLSSGEIGAAAFAELVGLPAAFEIGIGAAAGVAAIGISFGVGAIAGAVKRDKLKDAIHSGFSARSKIVKAYLIDSQLLNSIDAMISAINALKAAEIPLDQVTQKIKEMVSAARDRATSLSDKSVSSYLSELDKSRGSWTNED